MSLTVLIAAMVAAGVALALLVVWLLLRARARPKVIAAPTSQAAAAEPPSESPPTASMTMAAADSIVRAMAARGEIVQAIKMVREMTGLGLKEAKDYVDALPNVPPITEVARRMALAASGGAGVSGAAGSGASVRTDALALLARGDKLEAIKLVRERTGMGLKEAKDYVEDLAAGQPAAAVDPRRPLDDPRLRQAASELVAAGQLDQAMRLIQSASGCSIEAARHYIDQLRRG
jgi:ribosomal protein L7/L12